MTSVIVTTDLLFEQRPEALGGPRLTGAALDRLTRRCPIPEPGGASYRLRDARRLRGRPAADAVEAEAADRR
jgi:hypothetical protein